MATTSACWRVIHTAELLEHILLDLIPLTPGSRPDWDGSITKYVGCLKDDSNQRRTLLCSQRVCTAFKDTIASSSKLQDQLFLRPNSALHRFNPFFVQGTPITINLSASATFTCRIHGTSAYLSLQSTSWPSDPPLIMAATCEASWRRMYSGRTIDQVHFSTEEVAGVHRGMVRRKFAGLEVKLTDPKMGELMDMGLEMWHEFLATQPKWREAMKLAYGEDL